MPSEVMTEETIFFRAGYGGKDADARRFFLFRPVKQRAEASFGMVVNRYEQNHPKGAGHLEETIAVRVSGV